MCLREQLLWHCDLDECCRHRTTNEILVTRRLRAVTSSHILEYVLEDNPTKRYMASIGTSGFSSTPSYCPHSWTVSSGQNFFVLSLNQGAKQRAVATREKQYFCPNDPLVPLTTNLQKKCKTVLRSQNQSKNVQNANLDS